MAVLIPTLDWSDQPSVYYSVPQWLYDKLLSWYPKEKVAAYLEAVVSQSGHPMYVHCHTGRYRQSFRLQRRRYFCNEKHLMQTIVLN